MEFLVLMRMEVTSLKRAVINKHEPGTKNILIQKGEFNVEFGNFLPKIINLFLCRKQMEIIRGRKRVDDLTSPENCEKGQYKFSIFGLMKDEKLLS